MGGQRRLLRRDADRFRIYRSISGWIEFLWHQAAPSQCRGSPASTFFRELHVVHWSAPRGLMAVSNCSPQDRLILSHQSDGFPIRGLALFHIVTVGYHFGHAGCRPSSFPFPAAKECASLACPRLLISRFLVELHFRQSRACNHCNG